MPQDTVYFSDNPDKYVVLPNGWDTLPDDVKGTLFELTKDQRFEKKHSFMDDYGPFFYTVGILALIWIIIRIRDGRSRSFVAFGSLVNNEADYDIVENQSNPAPSTPDCLVYPGHELNIADEDIIKMLNRRSRYYVALPAADKEKFLYRLKKFMSRKNFYIHDKSGFKEMPVLISAAAIQLSFGLDKYLLPDFPNIHIFPQEFIATEPSIRFLEGNVSDNCINISWKHFLEGFQSTADGQNVGLHELAHAYHFQNFSTGNQVDADFVADFSRFDDCGNKAYQNELLPGADLYSRYAMRNFQEFWAESVEIFFERPADLNYRYPELYEALRDILNQDPLKTGQ